MEGFSLAASFALQSEVRVPGHPNRDRRAGYIPAVMYGHRVAPAALRIEARQLTAALARGAAHHLVELSVGDDTTPRTVVIKEIQRHPVTREIVHIDFQAVSAAERIHADVPLRLIGEEAVTKAGGILQVLLHAIRISCLPQDLPDHVDVAVADLAIGHARTVGDLPAPAGIQILNEPEEVVCSVLAPRTAEAAAGPAAPAGGGDGGPGDAKG